MANFSVTYDSEGSDNEEQQSTRKKLKFEITSLHKTRGNYPLVGAPVERCQIRKAGKYLIGPKIKENATPAESIVQHYIGRKEHINEFYHLKVLQLDTSRSDTNDEMQGKKLIHTEFSILSLLEGVEGIVRYHDLFTDIAYEEENARYTGIVKKRIVLVLDCRVQHPYCEESASYISLEKYVQKPEQISYTEAVHTFHDIVEIVHNMHKKNVIHGDLKPGNIVLHQYSRKLTIINFGLSKYLSSENKWVCENQKTSLAYMSPDEIRGIPYNAKPADMWSLGVVFYILLNGKFPFYNTNSKSIREHILSGVFDNPRDYNSATAITDIFHGLFNTNAQQRLTAKQLLIKLEYLIFTDRPVCLDQLVPYVSRVRRHNRRQTKSLSSRHNRQIVPILLKKRNDTGQATADFKDDAVVPVFIKSSNESATCENEVL